MIKIFNCFNKKQQKNIELIINKRRNGNNINTSIVLKILKDIRKNKKKALLKYEKKFSYNTKLNPTKKEIKKSINSLDPKVKKAIDNAYNRIMKFHKLQKIKNIRLVDKYRNVIEYKNIPLKSVGIYVPANLPSTLLMNAIPAKIAGIKKIVLANPRLNKKLNPAVMYAAKKCGIHSIINVGGAQAIGSLAYIQKVDKIIGPGNDYVARAKKEVFGDVGIEGMIAGPSEVTLIADKKTDINQIATSLVAQSEHGENSQSILLINQKGLAKQVVNKIKRVIENLPRKKIIEKSLDKNGMIIISKSQKQIIELVNFISPEHLEVLTTNYKKIIKNIYNAGSIGLGKYSPVAASDYNVGTNHTLGTLGSAKFASGLNLNDFYKKISLFSLTKKGIEVIGKEAITLAKYENLHAHALSIKSRIKGDN